MPYVGLKFVIVSQISYLATPICFDFRVTLYTDCHFLTGYYVNQNIIVLISSHLILALCFFLDLLCWNLGMSYTSCILYAVKFGLYKFKLIVNNI